jgi:hypothetical protein
LRLEVRWSERKRQNWRFAFQPNHFVFLDELEKGMTAFMSFVLAEIGG